MRAVIQRVSEASVTIAGQTRGVIRAGLLVLVGIEDSDTHEDIEWLSGKIVRLRVFPVSQFTLFASTKKGNRPSYIRAAKPEIAVPLYGAFLRQLGGDLGKPAQTGEFGADMKVALVNDGPVTILIDTKARE